MDSAATDQVTISDAPLTVAELLAAVGGAPVSLGPAARARIAASRAVLERALRAGGAIYGLSTQVGSGKDTRVAAEEMERQQRFLVMPHAGAFGPPLPTPVVRSAMVARVNGIARGGSGASPASDVLVSMLNAGVHPVLPATGSIGAGDLGPMAGIAQVATGEGRAEYRDEVMSGAEALRRAGITPLRLEGRDGLALISANGVSVGHAALVLARAARTADAADVAAVLSLEATDGNPSIYLPAVAEAKPFPGQIAAAAHLREVLDGSRLLRPGAARSVQDALSFRVVPQVHGAFREFIASATRAMEVELNAAGDNPLVDLGSGQVLSNGNFHPIVLAIACDALRVAVAHVGQLSERRMSHLWDAAMRAMATGGTTGAPAAAAAAALPGLQLRYPASAAFTALKVLAAPATLDSTSLDMGVEDHATGAPLSVAKTEEALDLLDDLLAIELLLAADVLALSPRPELGRGSARALRSVRETTEAAPSAAEAHRHLRERFPGA